jgi:hypothetical protein
MRSKLKTTFNCFRLVLSGEFSEHGDQLHKIGRWTLLVNKQ